MKINNGKIGGSAGSIDAAKLSKTDTTRGLKKDVKADMFGSGSLKGSANVDASERAQMMAKAKGIASEDSIDEAKVARFQKLIDEGKYTVDAEKVSDRLVDEHLLIPD